MTPKRKKILLKAAQNRQLDLAVVLENVHDPHNISAVLRTCDAVGVSSLYLLLTDPKMQRKKIQMGKRSSAGARKWMQVYRYHDIPKCFQDVRKSCDSIYGTFLGEKTALSPYRMDLTKPVAFVFGNEHRGLSKETKNHCDGHFLIPQSGMVKSLNVSVACAVTLYEAYRQRELAGMYERSVEDPSTIKTMQFFLDRIASGENGRNVESRI